MTHNNVPFDLKINTKFSSRNSNRILAFLTVLLLATALLPAFTLPVMAETENVTFLDETGSMKSVSATVLASQTDMLSTLTGGWYIVRGEFNVGDRV
ncbi:MAG: hypothetical protein LBE70_01080, partial [Nitrososphaerota archaeon]|nr:hypothetical protein [Nitrososphaerota archaeon]